MAKGNLFLGTAARSVGDVVMYRREGSQVSRVRVRKIANPKTEAQCRQRAYMAPIPKFFSPLAVVLERSFEGLSKAKSYAKFIKENANLARENDWLLPKGIGFFPLPYQLCQGTLPAMSYSIDDGFVWTVTGLDTDATSVGDISQSLVDSGYNVGDIVTIILIAGSIDNGFVPRTFQFAINTESTVTFATLFGANVNVRALANSLRIDDIGGVDIAGGAVIVARYENDKWRRSTQFVDVASSITGEIGTAAYKAAAIESYSASAAGANPMVYLDGDELDNA